MGVLVIIISIVSFVVGMAIAAVIAFELGKLNKKIEELQVQISNNNDEIINSRISQECTITSLRDSIKSEIPKGLFNFMYPAAKYSGGNRK